jgi:outer membrane protein assembly factor BamB
MTGPTRRRLLHTGGTLSLLALAGCETLTDIFATDKPPIPGKREAVVGTTRSLQPDVSDKRPVTVPPVVQNADWAQSGGVPIHAMQNVAVSSLNRAWRRSIGEGGGYRAKITATPVIAGGRVFTMDSNGSVSAFDAATGDRHWNTDTQADENRSTNVGGGLAVVGPVVYASTGRAEVLALNAATGKITWRSPLDSPARSAPTVVENRLFVTTLDERILALAIQDGKLLWSYQATAAATSVLGEPAPAYADGFVVGGFGSGDLVALRVESGSLAWSDNLAAARGVSSLADLSAIRALPVIVDNVVYAVGVGGLMVAIDLRSGRRLWEREIAGQYTPWVAGDWIFVLNRDQLLVCLDRSDGHVRWTSQLPQYEEPEKQRDPIYWIGPLLGSGVLYLAGSTKKVIAVNPTSGDIVGEHDLPDKASVSPVAAMGKLFIVTDDGSLTALG